MGQKYLLSIDGGGIRGIIPATALLKLEEATGRPLRETFSFVAGTSTGALLGAAIAAGIPARRIRDIYLTRAHEIFTPRGPWNEIRRLVTGHKYDIRNLVRVIEQEVGEKRAWTLNDSPIDLLLTAKGLDGRPWYFVKDHPKNSQFTGRFRLVDCATASAAAPTYFGPWKVGEEPGLVVDGGVGVTGNPVYQACVEAFYYHDQYQPEETVVISLGTGRYADNSEPRGFLPWVAWILNELLRSPGEQQTQLVRRHFPGMTFYRLNLDLKENIDMDGVESVDRLRQYGEEFAAQIEWGPILAAGASPFRVG